MLKQVQQDATRGFAKTYVTLNLFQGLSYFLQTVFDKLRLTNYIGILIVSNIGFGQQKSCKHLIICHPEPVEGLQ